MRIRVLRRVGLAAAALALATVGLAGSAISDSEDALDPAHNTSLPCESLGTPGLAPRSAGNIVHLANVCGFVGTDIEFQSRVDAEGKVHDFAFVGTMGAGTRIFDVTDPAHPVQVGGYVDPGWQNDVQVRGDVLVIGFDWLLVGANLSTCLQHKNLSNGSVSEAGVDIVRLDFDPETATFETSLLGCYLSGIETGGAHTTTIHPSGEWLTINTAFAGVEVVDIRGPEPTRVRHIPTSVVDEAHDLSFSRDGNTLYSAGINSTRIVDVTDVFDRAPTLVATVPNLSEAGGLTNPRNIQISHQSDVSADGKILAITDERGGGLSETRCNRDGNGVIGGMHFWALGEIGGVAASAGASPASPKKLGSWFYPNPLLAPDPLQAVLPRAERGCTIHVFRHGGNGTAGPGEVAPGFDGVSSLPARETVTAHYGAGVWHLDFSGAPTALDGTAEDDFTTWGNTVGWNVMPGADTWSAKEYKGAVYAGDMARGFDVYGFKDCQDVECIALPVNTPGRANGGGQIEGEDAELLILRGTAAGGRASFGFSVELAAGGLPTGDLNFVDHATRKHVDATVIDSFSAAANKATFTGRATVDGVPGVTFFVEVEDLGEPGRADTFRLVVGDGYGAAGVLEKGNIEVESSGLSVG